jgi:phytanoyl-CoA hydroxylase
MTLSVKQLAQFQRDGFLVLNRFADEASCDRLRARAEELVRQFDPRGLVSVFSTQDQNRISDAYFLESGGKIHFFSRNMLSFRTAP